MEENLARIQTIFGENSRAITILTELLQTPYQSSAYGLTSAAPVTPALLRLDPIWDPFARRSRFPKTLRRKAAVNKTAAVLGPPAVCCMEGILLSVHGILRWAPHLTQKAAQGCRVRSGKRSDFFPNLLLLSVRIWSAAISSLASI